MDPMLASFIQESRDNLETAGDCFLKLEKTPNDLELINDLFRSMHTIKGNSGLFDVHDLTLVVHAAEDVLDQAREGAFSLTAAHIDLFLDSMDQVNAWLEELEEQGELSSNSAEISAKLSAQLHGLLSKANDAAQDTGDDSPVSKNTESEEAGSAVVNAPKEKTACAPDWIVNVPNSVRQAIFSEQCKEAPLSTQKLIAVCYTPDEQCFFNGDDPLLTVQKLPGLQWYAIENNKPWAEAEDMDPFQCNVSFYLLIVGDEADIRQYLRYVADQFELVLFSIQELIFPEGAFENNDVYDLFLDDAPKALHDHDNDRLLRAIDSLLELGTQSVYQNSALTWLKTILSAELDLPHHLHALVKAIQSGDFTVSDDEVTSEIVTDEASELSSEAKAIPLSPAIENLFNTQLKILLMPCADNILEGRVASTAELVKTVFKQLHWQEKITGLEQAATASIEAGSGQLLHDYLQGCCGAQVNEPEITAATPPIDGQTSKEVTAKKAEKIAETSVDDKKSKKLVNKTLKVDQERIDGLMDLISELVVAKNALPFLARRAEEEFGVRELAKEIKAQYAVIDRLSDELQGAMMSVRMVPVSSVFQRFPRLVRDLSRRLDKKIQLVMEGEETEADKNVIENLADPLIHLVRNSLDHGIEMPAERKNKGKPEQGTLILRAIPADDQVIIEIIDDGKGIDPDVIKNKAYAKGIIDEHSLDTISDHDAVNLIFAAGLSSLEETTELSGRGVGMDVVRNAVKEAGGTVSVASELGKGTTLRLELPLSMAVARVMMIEVDNQFYGVSMDIIRETVRIPNNTIERIKHNEVVVLRDKLIPLQRMRNILGLEPPKQKPDEEAILIVAINGEEIGLIIDDFHEGLDVIQKPLEGVMVNYAMYAGATLLGDGRVLLILDLKELL